MSSSKSSRATPSPSATSGKKSSRATPSPSASKEQRDYQQFLRQLQVQLQQQGKKDDKKKTPLKTPPPPTRKPTSLFTSLGNRLRDNLGSLSRPSFGSSLPSFNRDTSNKGRGDSRSVVGRRPTPSARALAPSSSKQKRSFLVNISAQQEEKLEKLRTRDPVKYRMVEAIARQYSSRVGNKSLDEKEKYKELALSQGLKQQVKKRMLMSTKLTPRNPLKKSTRYDDTKIQEVYKNMYPVDMALDEDQKKAYFSDQKRQQIIRNIKKINQSIEKGRGGGIKWSPLPVFP